MLANHTKRLVVHNQTKCVLDFEGHAPPSILKVSNSGFSEIYSMSQLTC